MAGNVKGINERDLVSSVLVDFDETVDVRRLRRERLQRLKNAIGEAGLGAALLFDPVNVPYACGARWNEILDMRFKIEYHMLVPREGKPILYRATGLEPAVTEGVVEGRPMHSLESWDAGSLTPQLTSSWADAMVQATRELGVQSERIGLDRTDPQNIHALEARGLQIEDVLEALNRARAIKTVDEVALIRQSCAISDVVLWTVQQSIRPGITENELFAIMTFTNLRNNGERMDAKLLCAGGNTNPWVMRTTSPRMVRPGDLVAMDTDMAGPLGYFADVSRTYLCGDGPPNSEQMEAYKLAHDFLYRTIPLLTVGTSFQEISENAPPIPDAYKANRYLAIAHGVGMSDEWPNIFFADATPLGLGNPVGEIRENMVLSVEASFGRDDGREQVKLEEQVLITASGPEIISHAPFDWRFLE